MATVSPTTAHSIEALWGPGFSVGITFCLMMFGVSFCQMIFYFYSFPNDSRSLKSAIWTMFLLDSFHTIGFLGVFWNVLLSCRRNTSLECQWASQFETPPINWQTLMTFVGIWCISLSAQSFYVHRVWIISGKNNLVTGVIVLVAVAQTLLGMISGKIALASRDWQAMYGSLYPALSAGASSVYYMLITISIAYFLRAQTNSRRQDTYVRQAKVVFIEMGLMSCIVATIVTIMLSLPDIQSRLKWSIVSGSVLTKTYFNSMLAMLNARKVIRQRQFEARGQVFELRTLRSSTPNRAVSLEDT